MRFVPILVIFSLLLITPNYDAKCAFTQTCFDTGGQICFPPAPIEDGETESFPYNYSFIGQPACPDYINQNVCCNNYQNSVQFANFILSDQNFGSQNGGCDICAANLKRFWCYFTCSPNQSEFVSIGDLENRVNPSTGQIVQARTINVNISTDLSCSLFQSCEKVPFLTELSQTSTAAGFLTFMGENGVTQAKAWISFNIQSNNSNAMNLNMNDCSDKFNGHDQYGFNITQNCTCNTCASSCVPEGGIQIGNITDGFNGWAVLYMYIGVFVLAIIITIYRFIRKRNKNNRNPKIIESFSNDQDVNYTNSIGKNEQVFYYDFI